jgi:hypothetical protein
MTKLQMMQTNPGMMMKDPEMMEVLQALLGDLDFVCHYLRYIG